MGTGSRLARALRGHDRVAVDTAPLAYFPGGHATRDAVVDELLARAGHGLRMVDAIVAATALEEGCTALVGNDRALRRLEGVLSYVHLDDLVRGS